MPALYLAAGEVVPPLLVLCAPAASEVNLLGGVVVHVVSDLNTEILAPVTLLPVPQPLLLRVVVVVVILLPGESCQAVPQCRQPVRRHLHLVRPITTQTARKQSPV